MLEAMNRGVLWLIRLSQVAWCSGKVLKDRKTGVIIHIHKRGDMKEYTVASLSIFRGKVYVKCLVKMCCMAFEPKLENTQYRFRPRRSTTDQIFTIQQIFEKSWEYAKDVYACFVHFEKAYDWVPQGKSLGSAAGVRC